VGVRDPLHYGKAEARALATRPRPVGPVEALEDMRQAFGIYSDARICYLELCHSPLYRDLHRHSSPSIRVLDSVVDQVQRQLSQTIAISLDHDGVGNQFDFDSLMLRMPSDVIHGPTRDNVKTHWIALQGFLSCLGSGKHQEIRNNPRHPISFFLNAD
jgi:hypothetical protein